MKSGMGWPLRVEYMGLVKLEHWHAYRVEHNAAGDHDFSWQHKVLSG
jgi:hypothetical protein